MVWVSSFTHSGKWCTLQSIPSFGKNGIWFCQAIGFCKLVILPSRHGLSVPLFRCGSERLSLKEQVIVRTCTSVTILHKFDNCKQQSVGGHYGRLWVDIRSRNVNSNRPVRKCGLHPLIHTLAPSESSTKCGSGFFRGKVWIKVCNAHSG